MLKHDTWPTWDHPLNMQEVQPDKYYNIHETEQEIFWLKSDTILPKVHDIDKGVDSNLRPEKHVIKPLSDQDKLIQTQQ